MNRIQIPQSVKKAVKKAVKAPQCKIHGEKVIVNVGKNGVDKFEMHAIANIGPQGVYCNNDKFYGWEKF